MEDFAYYISGIYIYIYINVLCIHVYYIVVSIKTEMSMEDPFAHQFFASWIGPGWGIVHGPFLGDKNRAKRHGTRMKSAGGLIYGWEDFPLDLYLGC